jgi:hypothetical protein
MDKINPTETKNGRNNYTFSDILENVNSRRKKQTKVLLENLYTYIY